MLHRLLHGGLIVAAVAAWSLAAPTLGAASADDAQVTVVAPGGEQQTLSLEALGEGDVVERTYALRSAEGESAQTVTGFSPAALLDAAGVDPYGFSYLEVQRPAGGSVLLSRRHALDPGAFADGPPVIYATAVGTGFLRPSAAETDLNANDSFEAPQGVALVLRNGSPLRVRAQASTLRTRPGRPVTFTALVDRAGAGEQLSYSWYFDDGHSAAGASVRHRFAKRGSYDVVVGVTTPGDDAGASAVVTVQVGPPLAGPDRKGGGASKEADAPDHGAATGVESSPAPASRPPVERPSEQGPTPPEPAGRLVKGISIDAAQDHLLAKPVAARTGSVEPATGGIGIPPAGWGLLTTAGLLGAGALIEVRR